MKVKSDNIQEIFQFRDVGAAKPQGVQAVKLEAATTVETPKGAVKGKTGEYMLLTLRGDVFMLSASDFKTFYRFAGDE